MPARCQREFHNHRGIALARQLIHANRRLMRKRIQRQHGGEDPNSAVGQQNAQGCTYQRQKDRFREQLPDQTCAAGAYRCSNRQLVLPCNSPGQQKDRNIGASDHQQSDYCNEKQNQCPGKTAEHFFVQRHDGHPPAVAKVRIIFREAIDQNLKLAQSPRAGARLQFNERHPVIVRIAAWHSRQVHIGIAPGKPRLRYSDDGVQFVTQFDRFSDDVTVCRELPLPK